MKKLSMFMCAMILILPVWGIANAALHDRGGGLIYDDVLNVTWLQDANHAGGTMNWDDALAWAAALSYYDATRDTTWTDWRLASMDVDNDETVVQDCDADEVTCRDNEYAYMYYWNLGGSTNDDLTGDQTVGEVTLNNIQSNYWSSTSLTSLAKWGFRFDSGTEFANNKNDSYSVWAVRDGDVEPAPSQVPTVSEWGMTIFVILLVASSWRMMKQGRGRESA